MTEVINLLNEYDVIKAKERLTDKVYKGCKGAVLMVFEGESIAYEVEFIDEDGESLEVITVRDEDIEKI
jgi:hypothetical protein